MLKIPRGTPGTVFACLTTVCSFLLNSRVELDSVDFAVRGEPVYILRPRLLSVQGPWSRTGENWQRGTCKVGHIRLLGCNQFWKQFPWRQVNLEKPPKGDSDIVVNPVTMVYLIETLFKERDGSLEGSYRTILSTVWDNPVRRRLRQCKNYDIIP